MNSINRLRDAESYLRYAERELNKYIKEEINSDVSRMLTELDQMIWDLQSKIELYEED